MYKYKYKLYLYSAYSMYHIFIGAYDDEEMIMTMIWTLSPNTGAANGASQLSESEAMCVNCPTQRQRDWFFPVKVLLADLGFEPGTSCMTVSRSTNWAIDPQCFLVQLISFVVFCVFIFWSDVHLFWERLDWKGSSRERVYILSPFSSQIQC